jgi:predicted metal-dependent peptidase
MGISLIDVSQLPAIDRITRARILLNKKSPFFSYLVLHLEFERQDSIGTIGVDKSGRVYYNEEFIKGLTDEKICGLLCHEVWHTCASHLERKKSRDHDIFNISADISTNQILVTNGFELPDFGLVPNCNNHLTIKHPITHKPIIQITDLGNKETETIYEEIYPALKNIIKQDKGIGAGQIEEEGTEEGQKTANPFEMDRHLDKGRNKRELKDKGKNKEISTGTQEDMPKEKNWKKIMTEALYHAKNAGKEPLGIERHIEGMLSPKENYRELLQRFILNEINHDFDWSYPHKKSHAIGVYLPHMKKENIEMITIVDTSGSIDEQTELKQFLEHIISICQSFHNIKMTVLSCDSAVQSIHEVENGSIDTIMGLKLKGGGGTAFNPPFKWILENKPETKLVIYFTDGFNSDNVPDVCGFNTIWVITKNGTDASVKETGLVLKIREN